MFSFNEGVFVERQVIKKAVRGVPLLYRIRPTLRIATLQRRSANCDFGSIQHFRNAVKAKLTSVLINSTNAGFTKYL